MFADVEQQIPDLCEHSGQEILKSVRSAFYAVFDGHAGKNAADFCAEHMVACCFVLGTPPFVQIKAINIWGVGALQMCACVGILLYINIL